MCSAASMASEHRREDLVAVAQHVDAVAFGGGHADDALQRAAHAAGVRLGRAGIGAPPSGDAVSVVVTGRPPRRDGRRRGRRARTRPPSPRPAGAAAPARTASSWAATAAPKKMAIDDRKAHSSSATMPASGP